MVNKHELWEIPRPAVVKVKQKVENLQGASPKKTVL